MAIQLNEEFLRCYFDVQQAKWLYWSLVTIAAGQLIYFLGCPRTIKKYGSDRERFVIESLSSLPLPELHRIRAEHIRSLYKFGGGRLSVPFDPFANDLEAEFERKCLAARFNTIEKPSIPKYLSCYKEYLFVVRNDLIARPENLNFHKLDQLKASFPEAFFGQASDEGIMLEHAELGRIFRYGMQNEGSNENDWKTNSLNWSYKAENRCRKGLIWSVAVLYALGSVYFVVRAVSGMINMAIK